MVDKRYVKIGVAAMAALALIIGLAVGISKQQQNKTSVSSFAVESCNNIAGAASDSSNSKTSKSTSTTSTTSSSKSGKSGRRLDRRHLIVPGVENVQSDSGKRKLRNEIVKGTSISCCSCSLTWERRSPRLIRSTIIYCFSLTVFVFLRPIFINPQQHPPTNK